MRYHEILPLVMAGGKATRAEWAGRTETWRGMWLELVPAHPLPDGRTLEPLLGMGYPGQDKLVTYARSDRDELADDWELLP